MCLFRSFLKFLALYRPPTFLLLISSLSLFDGKLANAVCFYAYGDFIIISLNLIVLYWDELAID